MIPGNTLPLNEASVESLLRVLGRGKSSAKRADQIQSELCVEPQRTGESARALIQYAILQHQCLIGSGNRGYWLIDTREEFLCYMQNLERRIAGIQARQAALREAWLVRSGQEVP